MSESAPSADTTVTVVAAHRLKPGAEAAFERWEEGITATAREFEGFERSESLPPIPGIQEDWVVLFRFQSAALLQRWLESEQRQKWLDEGEPLFEGVQLHKVGTGLGGWFPATVAAGQAATEPPGYKQAMVVLLALYPTVMLLTLEFAPRLESLPLAANLFINNVVSVALLQWLLMPPLTRWLGRWLDDQGGRITAVGALGLMAAYAIMVAAFVALEG